MNNKSVGFIMFVVGIAIGSATTWKYAKKKYELIAQEEIDSVKGTFSKKENEQITKIAEIDVSNKSSRTNEKPSVAEYAAQLHEHGYTNYSNAVSEKETLKGAAAPMDKPYTIAPESFGEFEDYEKISLSYYADKALADEGDELVDDVDDTVGFDSLNHFGEYEDDSVFVRNDRLKCDYEILLDQRNYSDVVNKKPYQVED